MPYRFFRYSKTEPSRTIVAVVAIITLLAGLWLFTPWAISTLTTPAVSVGFNLPITIGALVNTAACIPGLIAVRKGTPGALAHGTFWLFIWYSFVTFVRIIVAPIGSLVFVPTFIIAAVLSVVYLEQRHLAQFGSRSEDA